MLGIDKSAQQDPHELSKLFLTKIEDGGKTKISPNIPSIADLMNGRQRFSMICKNCNSSSSQESIFQELDLTVEGYTR